MNARDKRNREAGDADQANPTSDENDANTIGSHAGRRWKKVAAAALFVLTSIATLVVQDLYKEAKVKVGAMPFSITIAPDDECPNGEWLFPADFDVRTLPRFDLLDSRWAYDHGGYTVGQSVIKLTFQGDSESAVVLQSMHVSVTERRAPTAGTVINKCPEGQFSALDTRGFTINLDNREPVITPRSSRREKAMAAGDASQYFTDFPYKISASDPEVFLLVAETEKCSCSWKARLDWTASGKAGTTTLDINSTPFRTSPKEPTERNYYYESNGTLHR
ncbi:MAG: hypothetical protein ACRDRQ_04990 [Pseudonocardiaceae bacterium]